MPISKFQNQRFKWAWQAQFLSHAFEILGNDAFFKDVQMISLSFFNIKKRVKLSCGQLVKKNINQKGRGKLKFQAAPL